VVPAVPHAVPAFLLLTGEFLVRIADTCGWRQNIQHVVSSDARGTVWAATRKRGAGSGTSPTDPWHGGGRSCRVRVSSAAFLPPRLGGTSGWRSASLPHLLPRHAACQVMLKTSPCPVRRVCSSFACTARCAGESLPWCWDPRGLRAQLGAAGGRLAINRLPRGGGGWAPTVANVENQPLRAYR